VEVKRGISWSKEQEHSAPREGAVPVIRIGNVQARLDLDDLIYISGLKPEAVEKKRVTAGWSVMVGSNGNRQRIGNAVLVGQDKTFLFASFLIAARPKEGSGIAPEFFYRWLSAERVQAYLSASSEGTTGLSNLSHTFFKAMAIPFPKELREQEAIAHLLDAVDTAMEHMRAAIEKTALLRRALMQELLPPWIGFKRLGRIPAGVHSVELAREVADVCNGSTPPRGDSRFWRNGNIPWLATGMVHARVITAGKEFVTEAALRECSISLLPVGTVLVGMIGQGRTRGMSAYLGINACINQNFGAFVPRQKVFGKWLFYYFDFHYSRLREVGGGTNQGALNCFLLKRLRLPLPRVERQKEVAGILDGVEELDRRQRAALAAEEQLKKSLMHDLLTGRVRIKS
jgi:type I restriction enzyme S subunit